LGSTIDLDRRPYTIVGVMPRNFEFPLDAGRLSHRDLWIPLSLTPAERRVRGAASTSAWSRDLSLALLRHERSKTLIA